MYISKLIVRNFKGIRNVSMDLSGKINVIIGPNAVGKTTILESIRLSKALLIPRTQNETLQTLLSLGAASPHNPQSLIPTAIANRNDAAISIEYSIILSDAEVVQINALREQVVYQLALAQSGASNLNPSQVAAFAASERGKAVFSHARNQVDLALSGVSANKILSLSMTIDPSSSQINSSSIVHQVMFTVLERNLPVQKTLFSFYPADRAMPIGEQPVQLGVADAGNQLESYNSQPQLKYQRLKNLIFNTALQPNRMNYLENQFQSIFSNILRNKKLDSIGINRFGMLEIMIEDTVSGAKFNIDNLSSGEKGLLLTLLTLSIEMESGGIVLMDEPELHLNQTVCRDLLEYMKREFADTRNLQIIMCTHSPGILAGVFEKADCSLFHLRSGENIVRVKSTDRQELKDVLHKLGSSESEPLLYKGIMYVEGVDDLDVIEAGFSDLTNRFLIKQSQGRGRITQAIMELQESEKRGDSTGVHLFVFDNDGVSTTLSSTQNVKVLQLKRYCIENYLLDADAIMEVLRGNKAVHSYKTSQDLRDELKRMAFTQISNRAFENIRKDFGIEKFGFDVKGLRGLDVPDILQRVKEQIEMNQHLAAELAGRIHAGEIESAMRGERASIEKEWETKWQDLANGKFVFQDLIQSVKVGSDKSSFKRQIIREMRNQKSDAYDVLKGELSGLFFSVI